MTLNLTTLSVTGAILFWLGIMVCVASLVLFLAVTGGISEAVVSHETVGSAGTLHFPHSTQLLLGWKEKAVFLLPFISGLLLVASGTWISVKIPKFQDTFHRANIHFNSLK